MKSIAPHPRRRWLSVVLGALLLVVSSTASAQTTSIVAAVAHQTGGSVHLFTLHGTSPLDALPPIPGSGSTPSFAAFNHKGELFVTHTGGTADSIERFVIDAYGHHTPNGSISGNGVSVPRGIAFSPWGELFVSNFSAGTVSRFSFDAAGNAHPNGTIRVGQFVQGLAFSEEGELFVAEWQTNHVARFLFDADKNAITHGSILLPGDPDNRLHGLAFNVAGELFVAKTYVGRVYRVLFDADGRATPHGYISVPGVNVLDVAFSRAGELFVTDLSASGGIHRFLFDPEGHAVPNGFTGTTSVLAGIAIYTPSALRLSKTVVSGCVKATGKITLMEPAPAGGLTAALHSDNLNATVPTSISLKAGATTKTFSIQTSAVAARETATIEASISGRVLSATLTLKPMGPKSVTLTPNPVVGGATVAGLVTLECPAGPGDIEVALTSTKAFIAEPTTDTILVPAGTQSLPFEVRTTPVFAPVDLAIKATANEVTKAKKLMMNPVP